VTPASLKQALWSAYLLGSTLLTRQVLAGRSGPRRFDRVVIVAALGKQNGISRGAHLQLQALRNLGVDADLVDATPALRNPLFRIKHEPGSAYIFHTGAPQTASLIASVLPAAARAYRIGYWAWELPDPPPAWRNCEATIDEVWTPSRFSRDSLRRLLRKPVEVVPHYLPAEPRRWRDPTRPFTVLAMADTRSSLARKNPAGAVQAFAQAFGESPAARLLLKLSGPDDAVSAFMSSLGGLAQRSNIEILRGFLDAAGLSALYARADVLLSLHRAEGFGLPMLEALARGIPVVATAWSGNTDFAHSDNSIEVPYRLTPVADPAAIYSASSWAEPDIAAAASGLRRLADDTAFYDRLAEAAYEGVTTESRCFPLAPQPEAATAVNAALRAGGSKVENPLRRHAIAK
jgi:glycosyltransferase involved in cell wall biosynthesis